MQEFIDWFSKYDNLIPFVQVFVAGVTAFATVVLAFVTRNLARVSEQKPYVICSLESSLSTPRFVNFVIINTGNAPAFDIKAETSPPIPYVDGSEPELDVGSDFSILTLPPNQKCSFSGFDITKFPMKKFDITISWALKPNGKRQKPLTHSINNRGDRGGWHDKSLDEIARELEKITKHFRKFKP